MTCIQHTILVQTLPTRMEESTLCSNSPDNVGPSSSAEEWGTVRTAQSGLRHLIRPVRNYKVRTITAQAINDLLRHWAAPLTKLGENHRNSRDGLVMKVIKANLKDLHKDCNQAHESIVTGQCSRLNKEQQARLDIEIAKLLVRSLLTLRLCFCTNFFSGLFC